MLFVLGCSEPEPDTDFNDDPVARVLGERTSYTAGEKFDIGVSLVRRSSSGDRESAEGRIAFQNGDSWCQATEPRLNNLPLDWIGEWGGAFVSKHIYYGDHLSLYGELDSALLTYSDYRGESGAVNLAVVQPLLLTSRPISITPDQDLIIPYSNPINGGLLHVTVATLDTRQNDKSFYYERPDSGTVYIRALDLPRTEHTIMYSIDVQREGFTKAVTPSGKRIGVYSSETTGFGVLVE